MSQVTVAKVIVDTLIAAGVKRIYGVVGDSLNGMLEEIRKSKEIEWVGVRHEETAAFAAGAEAHVTGSLAVCAGSCGPGNMHLVNGLYDCHRSRVPVLAIAAQIPSNEIGSNYFQETHPDHLFKPCSTYCELVSQPSQMPRVLEIAIQTALATSNVAVVAIPGDIAFKKIEARKPSASVQRKRTIMRPGDEDIAHMAQILDDSERVAIFAGAGCAGAHAEVMQLAEKLQAPVVGTLRGIEHMAHDNPYDVGLTGLIGYSTGYHATENCDTLVLLGTDFPYTQFYPQKANIIQVDRRGENLGRRTRIDLGLVGDVKPTIEAVLPRLKRTHDSKFLDKLVRYYREVRQDLAEQSAITPGKTPIHPQSVARIIDQLAADDAIFTCDVGTPTIWAARYLTMNGRRRLMGSFSHGSMANALPQAIGAQCAFPNRQVVTFSGDGGLSMLLGDILSLKQHNLPIKIVVFSNGSLGFVELEMMAAGILGSGTELVNPDFVHIAKAAGMHGVRVDDPGDLESAMRDAFSHDGPALVDVRVNRVELSMPPTIEVGQAVGMNVWALKAVLNGRGNEVIDLAKTHLFR